MPLSSARDNAVREAFAVAGERAVAVLAAGNALLSWRSAGASGRALCYALLAARYSALLTARNVLAAFVLAFASAPLLALGRRELTLALGVHVLPALRRAQAALAAARAAAISRAQANAQVALIAGPALAAALGYAFVSRCRRQRRAQRMQTLARTCARERSRANARKLTSIAFAVGLVELLGRVRDAGVVRCGRGRARVERQHQRAPRLRRRRRAARRRRRGREQGRVTRGRETERVPVACASALCVFWACLNLDVHARALAGVRRGWPRRIWVREQRVTALVPRAKIQSRPLSPSRPRRSSSSLSRRERSAKCAAPE